MQTIIIISTDPRIAAVKEQIQPLVIAKISISPDFETGLAAIFRKMPEAVFLQQKINGIRAERVTRHVRSLLQSNSPVFIHLGSDAANDLEGIDSDSVIDLALPVDQLVDAFKTQIKKIPLIRWKELAPRKTVGA